MRFFQGKFRSAFITTYAVVLEFKIIMPPFLLHCFCKGCSITVLYILFFLLICRIHTDEGIIKLQCIRQSSLYYVRRFQSTSFGFGSSFICLSLW